MTVEVLEKLLVLRRDRNLMIQLEFSCRTQRSKISQCRSEDGHVRWMRLCPALQSLETSPPAHSKGLLERPAVRIDHGHIAIGKATDLQAVIAQERHARPQYRLHILEV